MVDRCEECGSTDIHRRELFGLVVDECGLCEHLQGDDAIVEKVLGLRRAQSMGVSPDLLGLIEVLQAIPGLSVEQGLSLVSGAEMPPSLFFTLSAHPLEVLDRLARSLELARRRTSTLWILEVAHQNKLMFVLRPRLFSLPREWGEVDALALRRDLGVLRDALERDTQLPWWRLT